MSIMRPNPNGISNDGRHIYVTCAHGASFQNMNRKDVWSSVVTNYGAWGLHRALQKATLPTRMNIRFRTNSQPRSRLQDKSAPASSSVGISHGVQRCFLQQPYGYRHNGQSMYINGHMYYEGFAVGGLMRGLTTTSASKWTTNTLYDSPFPHRTHYETASQILCHVDHYAMGTRKIGTKGVVC